MKAWHLQIAEHEGDDRRGRAEMRECSIAVLSLDHSIAGVGQVEVEDRAAEFVIINQQDGAGRHGHVVARVSTKSVRRAKNRCRER